MGTAGEDASSFDDDALTPGATYSYRVRACRDDVCSASSAEAEVGGDALLDERTGTFYLRNGPTDWPTIQYGYDGP